MSKRQKRHNLHLSADEQSMLGELAGAMGLNKMDAVRQLIWAGHGHMKNYLAAHELPADTLLRLDASGELHHYEALPWDRRRVIRNIEGALVLDRPTSHILARLAARTKLRPEKLVQDLVDHATAGTDLEFKPSGA